MWHYYIEDLDIMQRVRRAEVVGNKSRGRVVVRERYLRSDIPCRSYLCSTCSRELPPLLSSSPATIYIIPDASALLHYLEVFESPYVENMIILESVLAQVKAESDSKTIQRIKKMLHNPIKCCISFPNETSEHTFTPRQQETVGDNNFLSPELLPLWQYKCIENTAKWYFEHLTSPESPSIIIVRGDDEKILENALCHDGVTSLSMNEFIMNYFSDNKDIVSLTHSLKEVREEEENKLENVSSKHYSEYLPTDTIESGIKSGILYSGMLQVNRHATNEAFVRISSSQALPHGLEDDIFISSKIFRNRAVHGDTVAVELLTKENWTSPSRSIQEAPKPSESDIISASDEIEENESSMVPARPTGRVVGIVQRNWRLYAATLPLDDKDINSSTRKLLTIPFDPRIPKIRIASKNAEELIQQRLAVRIDDWPRNSKYPNGHYVSLLGPVNNIDAETKVLMIENDISLERGFSASCMAHLPNKVEDWKISDEDIATRRDLRDRLIMSIDPPGCEDIDDALSLYIPEASKEGKSTIEIGVHIADVTHFVPRDSLLDREARERGTTVYLADRRMDMLPFILSGELCSLREQQNRFAMSVLWTIDATTYEVLDIWYGKTIIFSSHEFSYQTAHTILMDELDDEQKQKLDAKTGRLGEYKQVRAALVKLLDIARKYRKGREEKGSLELHSTEVKFEMTEQKTPAAIKTKQTLEVMKMVEEYMVLANQSVAKRIYESFPSCSLLRRHPHPRVSDFHNLLQTAASMGIPMDVSSNKALAKSLNDSNTGDQTMNNILRMLATQAMSEAMYISTGDYEMEDFYHYGLAAEFYTHFTSPIRRYADVVVHRLLFDSLEKEKAPVKHISSQKEIADICKHINVQNRNAKIASMDSTKLFHGLYFRTQKEENQGEGVKAEGIIYSIRSNGFIVYVPEYGVKGMVYLEDMEGNSLIPLRGVASKLPKFRNIELSGSFSHDKEKDEMVLSSSKGPISIPKFSYCTVEINVVESTIRWPTIQLTLISFNLNTKRKDIVPIKLSELSTRTKEASSSALRDKNAKLLKDETTSRIVDEKCVKKYQQTPEKESIYLLFEQFRAITLK